MKIQSNYVATAFYPKIIGDNLFIVMPFFDCSLQSLLEEVAEGKKNISYLDGLVIACKVTKALIELKRNGIKYHQDFNPPNILIKLPDKESKDSPTNNYLNYHIVVADFGIANLRDRIGPTLGGEGGKFPYKAPEQYCPKKYETYDPDIFALGIMIYMIFTGKHPSGLENKKALKKSTSESKFKSWMLSEDKDIETLENTDLQDYINKMLKNDPAERPDLDNFYTFIFGELKKEDSFLHYQLVDFFDYRDTFDTTGDRIDKLFRLNKVANLSKKHEREVFDELHEELNTVKSNLKNIEDVVYYSELMKCLNPFFKKGYLQQDLLKVEYSVNLRIWFKWYKEMKVFHCYKFKVEYRDLTIIDIAKGLKEYEAANEYISLSIQYLLELDTEAEVEAFFEEFNDKVFLSYFYYNRALDWHQTDIFKALDFLAKAKEQHPTEALFYFNEGKWIKQFLMLWKRNILPVPYELSESQKEELKAKKKIAFEQYEVMDRLVNQ